MVIAAHLPRMDDNNPAHECSCACHEAHHDDPDHGPRPRLGDTRHREGMDDIDPDLYSQLRLLTPEETSALTGLSVKSLAHYRTQRTGPAFIRVKGTTRGSATDRAAGNVRYTAQALLDWYAALADETAEDGQLMSNPRLGPGEHGQPWTTKRPNGRIRATVRVRGRDGRVRQLTATEDTKGAALRALQRKLNAWRPEASANGVKPAMTAAPGSRPGTTTPAPTSGPRPPTRSSTPSPATAHESTTQDTRSTAGVVASLAGITNPLVSGQAAQHQCQQFAALPALPYEVGRRLLQKGSL